MTRPSKQGTLYNCPTCDNPPWLLNFMGKDGKHVMHISCCKIQVDESEYIEQAFSNWNKTVEELCDLIEDNESTS